VLSWSLKIRQEFLGGNDLYLAIVSDSEQALVTRDEEIRFRRYGGAEHQVVLLVWRDASNGRVRAFPGCSPPQIRQEAHTFFTGKASGDIWTIEDDTQGREHFVGQEDLKLAAEISFSLFSFHAFT
jgi:hypothetical protein